MFLTNTSANNARLFDVVYLEAFRENLFGFSNVVSVTLDRYSFATSAT